MKLKNAVFLSFKENKTIINFGTKEYSIKDKNKKFFNELRNLSKDNSSIELIKFLEEKKLIENSQIDYTKHDFENRNIEYLKNRCKVYDRNINTTINTIFQSKIVILGCGGVGTVVLDNLVRAGFKNFVLIDADLVNPDNLNRQLFFTYEDIGQKKVRVLSNRLKSAKRDIKVKIHDTYVENVNDLKNAISSDASFVLNAADYPKNIENIVLGYCNQLAIPCMSISIGLFTATWGPIFDTQNKYIFDEEDLKYRYPLRASFPTTNMIGSSFAAQEIFDYLFSTVISTGYNFYRRNTINFNEMRINNE